LFKKELRILRGMTTLQAPRDRPTLTLAELAPVIAQYPDLKPPRAIIWQSPRPFAASGLVVCGSAEIFVKRHHRAVRTLAQLTEEHAFMQHLHAAGASVPQVLTRHDGVGVAEHSDYTYELHHKSEGRDLYRNAESWTPIGGPHHAAAAGRALGALHRAASGYDAPPRRADLLVADCRLATAPDLLHAIAARAAEQPLLAAALADRPWRADIERTLLPRHANLLPHVPALTPLWTHNDFHASNLLWNLDGNVASILDFGLANRTNAVFDLATAIERNTIAWLDLADGVTDIGHFELARAMIAGYCEAYDLPAEQMRALPHLLPLVHIEFALSELAYFHGVTQSAVNAELAYSDFLLGHATWFSAPDGQDFLNAITGQTERTGIYHG
jgi:Ser/Thr protein kinase RdoA (MazF antagonist)